MIITILDKTHDEHHTFDFSLSGDIREDLVHIFDCVYSMIFYECDEIFIEVKNHNEYHELDKLIAMEMEDMENSPMWFDRMLLIALINAKYDYLYKGYNFDDYNFEEFKKSRGLD